MSDPQHGNSWGAQRLADLEFSNDSDLMRHTLMRRCCGDTVNMASNLQFTIHRSQSWLLQHHVLEQGCTTYFTDSARNISGREVGAWGQPPVGSRGQSPWSEVQGTKLMMIC